MHPLPLLSFYLLRFFKVRNTVLDHINAKNSTFIKEVYQNLKEINISNVNIIKLAKCVFIMYVTAK